MTFEKIVELLVQSKGMDVQEITMESNFQELGLDSLDMVELLMTLEDTVGITLEPDPAIKTVSDLVQYIDSAKA